jgi:hypothetical protein
LTKGTKPKVESFACEKSESHRITTDPNEIDVTFLIVVIVRMTQISGLTTNFSSPIDCVDGSD